MRGDSNYAWPSAEVAVMGAKGAVSIIFRDPKARVRNFILGRILFRTEKYQQKNSEHEFHKSEI